MSLKPGLYNINIKALNNVSHRFKIYNIRLIFRPSFHVPAVLKTHNIQILCTAWIPPNGTHILHCPKGGVLAHL